MKEKERFKNSLLQYLSAKNFNVSQNPMPCINPDHADMKKPSMIINESNFKCMGRCGIHGDVYDAARILTGASNFNEQFEEVERTITGMVSDSYIPPKKPKITVDPDCVKAVEKFVGTHPARDKAVLAFLKERGYSQDTANKIKSFYAYWPGKDQALKTLDEKTLTMAGVPEKAWYYPGVVCKLASGWKLMFYKKNKEGVRKCEKRNSVSAKTFPSPFTEDEITGTVYITEAETSAISMRACGWNNTFSSGSVNGITKNNVHLLKKAKCIIILFDGDNAGWFFSGLDKTFRDKKTGDVKRATSVPEKIFNAGFEGTIYAGRMPENRDPDDFLREGKIEDLQKIIDDATEITPGEAKGKPEDKTVDERAKPPFRFLGFDEKYYYVLPTSQDLPFLVARGERSIKDKMFEIAPRSWWAKVFYTEDEVQGVTVFKFNQIDAVQWFRDECYKVGIFDDSRIKGSGVFFDQDQFVINTGDGLKVNNKKLISYGNWKGHNFYVRSKRKFDVTGKKWTLDKSVNLWEQLNTFSYEKKIDPIAVLGYISMSPYSGILDRRPCIWLTGGAGTGKSFIIDELISPGIGGEHYALLTEGLSTEAYIRQSLKRDAIPVVIDELEADTPKDRLTVKSIVRLNRSSYGGKIAGRGSTGDTPVDYKLKSMFCFASVNVLLSNQADETRIHIVRMKPHNGECAPPRDFSGLRSRTFSKLPKIMNDIAACKKVILDQGLPSRIADTYSPFFAAAWNVLFDYEFLQGPEDNKIISQFYAAIMELSQTEISADEEKVVYRILQQKRRIDSQEELSVAEMITLKPADNATGDEINFKNMAAKNEIIHKDRIQRIGFKRYNLNDEWKTEVLAIASNHSEIQKMLEDTSFQNYEEILRRNSSVIHKRHKVRFAGVPLWAVVFDWNKFQKKYLSEDGEE